MSSNSRGGSGSGSITGFPRLSLRSLLLSGPFQRKNKANRTRTTTLRVRSKGVSDSDGGSLESVACGGGRVRPCGDVGLRASLVSAPRLPQNSSSTLLSDSNRPCCSKYDNTSDDAPRSHQFDVEYHAHPSCSGRRRQSAMESTEPIFNEYPTDDQATTSGVGSGGDSGTSSDDLSAPSTSAAAASAAPLPWRGSRCIGKGYRANSGSSSVGSGAETTDGMWPTTGSHVQRECLLCLQDISSDQYPKLLTCPHSACVTCFKQYLAMEISESRVNITCPKCNELMHPNDIHNILDNRELSLKFEDFMLRRVLFMDPDTRWCPAPDCGYAVIASGCASCPKLKCERPGCPSYFCYHCKAEWHPNQTCDMARTQRGPHFTYSSSSAHNDDDVKACPRCQVLIVKMDDGSCNHMTCAVCGAEFCWLCMKEVSDLHYLSPSGCTFWGKKPWSRKKKVLWQLGTLVGAPLGIALLAGLAVPAIIIGIPIWAGRKIHQKYSSAGRHKRNMMVVCGVLWSSLLSPVVAGVAVSIGVPILLAYVYGVVPISLCRSSGCGVITSAAGVRIAFDDEAENNVISPANFAMSGVAAMRSLAKLSDNTAGCSSSGAAGGAGSVSCDGVSTGSIGGAGAEPDRESASNVAIAPPSLAGSIASSSCFSPRSHKLEVHLEMGSEGGEETSSLAVSETNTLDHDNASTKALAGSIARYKLSDQGEVVSMVGMSNVAQAGDSASTIMDPSASSAGAAPSILSSISANTTTNLYMPSSKARTSATSSRYHGDSRQYEGGSGGEEYDGEASSYVGGVSSASRGRDGYGLEEGGYISGGDGMDSHNYVVTGRNSALNGSDLRLDSVSAIITARKMSAQAKGVTFSIGSASSQSRDHISLNLDDPMMAASNSEVCSAASLSGVSASAVSATSGTAVSGNFIGDENLLAKCDVQSYSSDCYISNEKDYLVQPNDDNDKVSYDDHWANSNSCSNNNLERSGYTAGGGASSRVDLHVDYREAYGGAHYDDSKTKSYELQNVSNKYKTNDTNLNELTTANSNLRNSPPVIVYMSEDSKLHNATVAESSNGPPLQRHRSVPENCCSGVSPARCESLSTLQIS